MQHFLFRSSVKVHCTKAFVASVIGLILCSNLALTRGLAINGDIALRRSESEGSKKQVDSRLTAATSRFSLKLYDQILKRRTSKMNTFVSPASVMLALAMTYNGADGTTRQGMARALEIEGMSLEEANRAFAGMKSALAPTDPKIQLKIANSIWARNGFDLNPAFIERNKEHYGAEIASLDFSDPAAPKTINSWVNKNTEGKIDKIVDQIKPEDVLFLIMQSTSKANGSLNSRKKVRNLTCLDLPAGSKRNSQ